MTSHGLVRAISLAVVLFSCRSREPAPEGSAASPAQDATPTTVATEGTAADGPHAPGAVGYELPPEELRRATFLKTAVLILPADAGDAVATLFGETGVRFARLGEAERFGQYSCGGVEESAVRGWVDLTARELATHSPALVRHSGTRWVVFCRELRQGGQERGAVPAGPAGTLLIDPGQLDSEDFYRRYLHHELFHMIDFAEGRSRVDAEWAGLNTPGARYGGGGRVARDASNALGSGGSGFVTEYARSGVEEDKAELFRFLALAPAELADLAQRDPVIAAKRDLLLRRLAPYCADDPARAVCREPVE